MLPAVTPPRLRPFGSGLAAVGLSMAWPRQWNGKQSSRKEKAAALEMSSKIKGERGGSTTVVLCEEGSEVYEFWEALPGGKGAVMAADDPSLQDDSAAEASAKEVRRHTFRHSLRHKLLPIGEPRFVA